MNKILEIKNRSVFYEYFIDARYEAGIVLLGTEVKSLRDGKVSFNDSYCQLHKGEIWLKSLHIAEYSHGTVNNHDPLRERKLLLQKRDTLVTLRIFFNDKSLVKVEIGLAKGKKLHDKRESIRQKDVDREMKRFLS